MTQKDDLLVFDEDEAVKYIIKNMPSKYKNKISEEDVDYVLDIMYDFYDKEGLIDEESTEEANIDEEDMFDFIFKCIQKENVSELSKEELQIVLDGEFEYGKSIGVYKEID